MKSMRGAACAVVPVIFLAGCSSYRTAVVPAAGDPEPAAGSDVPAVRLGDQARVHLRTGKVLEGEVVAIDRAAITVARVGNYGLEETAVPFGAIRKIEAPRGDAGTGLVGGVRGTAALLGIAALLVLIFGFSGGSSLG